MRRLALSYLLGGFMLFGLSAWSLPAQAVSTQALDTYTGDVSDLVFAENSSGNMAMVTATEDQSGVQLWTYLRSNKFWYESEVLANETVEGATSYVIEDLQVVDVPNVWLVVWTTQYYDVNGEYLDTKYNVYYTNRKAKNVTSGLTSDMTDAEVTEDTSEIKAVPTTGGVYDDAYIIWVDTDTTLQVAGFYAYSYGTVTDATTLSDMHSSLDFVTTSVKDTLYMLWRSDNRTLIMARLSNEFYGDLVADFQITVSTDYRSKPLDLVVGEDESVFALYDRNYEVKRIEVDKNGGMETAEVVFDHMNTTITPETISATYNDYGAGQYDVTVKDANTLSLAHWNEQNGWVKDKNFFTGAQAKLGLPQIRPYADGVVQVIWDFNDHWYIKEYSPTTKAWSDNATLGQDYGSLDLESPFTQDPVQSVDGLSYIDVFEKSNTDQFVLKQLKLGETDLSTALGVQLPSNYNVVYQAVKGNYHFVILQKGDALRSIVKKQAELF